MKNWPGWNSPPGEVRAAAEPRPSAMKPGSSWPCASGVRPFKLARWTRGALGLSAAVLWLAAAQPARAQAVDIVLTDGLIGAGFGAAMAIAHAAMMDDHERGMRRVPMAAAIGAVLGIALGSLEVSGAFAAYDGERRRIAWGLPRPRLDSGPLGWRTRLAVFEAKF